MAVTALVIGPMVLLGVYFGFYLGGVLGYSQPILAIVFSTVAFLAAVWIVIKIVVLIVKRSQPTASAS
jgi:F0F1-type ATP synthase assembly protein I